MNLFGWLVPPWLKYGVPALIVLGVIAWAGHWAYARGEASVQAKWDADKAVRAIVLEDAQRNVIAAIQKQHAAEAAAEKVHADAEARGRQLAADFDSRLRDVTAALRSRALSAAVGNSPLPAGTAPGPGGDSEIERLAGEVEERARATIAACLHDSAELAGVLTLGTDQVRP